MYIEVQETPNPNTLKFLLQTNIVETNKTYHFHTQDESKKSPLAYNLFNIKGIKAVFLATNFVSVAVNSEDDWSYVKTNVLSLITDFLNSGQPALAETIDSLEDSFIIEGKNEAEKEIISKIQELFEERIRPAVAMDGGDILFRSYEDGIVYLSLYGSCSGCPSSTVTLKNGIENMLKYYIPEVKEVVSIE